MTDASKLDTRIDEIVRDFGGDGQRATALRRRLRELTELSRAGEAVAGANRRRLTALVVAATKLDVAAALVKEATVNIAASGLFPVEVREEAQKIAAEIDAYVQRRIASTIEFIP